MGITAFMSAKELGRFLAVVGIGIGIAELASPQMVRDKVGLDASDDWIRGLGARGVASGIGILATGTSTPSLWSRVLGDLMDIGVLQWLRNKDPIHDPKVRTAVTAMLGIAALDLIAAALA